MIGSCTLLVKKGLTYDAHVIGMLSLQFGMVNALNRKRPAKTLGTLVLESLPKWEKLGADASGLTEDEAQAVMHSTHCVSPEYGPGYSKWAGDGIYLLDGERLFSVKRDKDWAYEGLEDITDKTK